MKMKMMTMMMEEIVMNSSDNGDKDHKICITRQVKLRNTPNISLFINNKIVVIIVLKYNECRIQKVKSINKFY